MRAQLVELAAPLVEAVLLSAPRRAGGPRAVGLERAVHAFMPAVLLGGGGLDQVGQDAEAHPPDREGREPAERLGGEWDRVCERMRTGSPYA